MQNDRFADRDTGEGSLSLTHPDRGIDPGYYLHLVRRRWKYLLIGAAIGALLVIGLHYDRAPGYTAQALLQSEQQQSALDALGLGGQRTREELAAELELLEARPVIASVVDSLGLRLRLAERPPFRSDVFRSVVVPPEATAGSFVLGRRGDQYVVRDQSTGEDLAQAGAGGELTVAGARLLLAREPAVTEEEVAFSVRGRSATIDGLRIAIRVEQERGTNLLRITYRDPDPQLAAATANALARAYQHQAALRAREDASRRRSFLAQRLSSVSDSLEAAQDVLLEFQARSSTVNPREEGQTLSSMLVTAQEELRTLENQEQTLEDLIDSFVGGQREALRQMVVLSRDLFPAAQTLYTRLQDLETRRSQLTASPLVGRTANDPEVQVLDSLIAETQLEMQLTANQTLSVIRDERERMAVRVAELREQVGGVPAMSTTYGRLEQRVAAIQNMYEMLAEKYYEAQVAEAVEAGNVRVVDEAVVPEMPDPSPFRLHLLFAMAAGLAGGFLVALARDRMDTRLTSVEEGVQAVRAEVLGTIPLVSRGMNGNESALLTADREVELEAFRILRTNLRFVREEQVRILGVTSSKPSEGKSFVAANLARVIAREGRSVLLIDADLRRPVQHKVFGIRQGPGLTDWIVAEEGHAGVVQRIEGEDKLFVLTAGSMVPNPAELLGGSRFPQLIEKAQERYDFVIVDTPPVLAVSDASIIGSVIGGVVVIAKVDSTEIPALRRGAEQLRRSDTAVLGLVMNGVRVGSESGSYYAYDSDYFRPNGDSTEPSWLKRVVELARR